MTRGRALRAAALLLLPSAILLALAWCIYDYYRIRVPARVGSDARVAAIASLRAALEHGEVRQPESPELERSLPNRGPVVVRVWRMGSELSRIEGRGSSAADAIADAAALLAVDPALARLSRANKERTQIEIDLVVGRGPLSSSTELSRAFSLHPGIEGFGVTLDGEREILLLPRDLIAKRLLTASTPFKFMPEVMLGFDFERAEMVLAGLAELPAGGYGSAARDYWRFRCDSFVEAPWRSTGRGEPLALTRGRPQAPELSREVLRDGAVAGGHYLVAHLFSTGRYVYEVDLSNGHSTDPRAPQPYSLPRHAGTTYYLAELYRLTGEEFLREPIERAFRHLVELVDAGGCVGVLPNGRDFACVVDRGQKVASLGSSALALVALVEYKRATGSGKYDELSQRLTEWILYMQRPDGSFAHQYDVQTQSVDEETELFFFSGEAALAMARMHSVYGDARTLSATERALDYLVGWYDFFAGGFFYGEEHWTCIAAEAAWPALKHERYLDFCEGYGEFLRRQQPGPGDFPDQADLAGVYTFTPFIMPANTPGGSRTEAMLSAYQLSVHHGSPSEPLFGQILDAMRYSLGQQVRADTAWAIPLQTLPDGAVPATPIDPKVRIDYVQHVCSAMIRTSELL